MSERPPPDSPEAWLQRARSDLALGRAALASPAVLKEECLLSCSTMWRKGTKGFAGKPTDTIPTNARS
jgi:hypothetical protein